MRKDYIIYSDIDKEKTNDAFVESYWEKIWLMQGGPKYKIHSILKREEYKALVEQLARIGNNSKILDAGCGLGEWTVTLSRTGYNIEGIDVAKEIVTKLKSIFTDCLFSIADIRNTGKENNSYDCVFSWGLFEHFENGLQDCLKEAYRILVPNGILLISVPYDNIRHALRAIKSLSEIEKVNRNHRFYQWRFTKAELYKELLISGFNVNYIKPIHKQHGLLRFLYHEIHLDHRWLITKALSYILQPLFPHIFVSHMLLAVATKPSES